MNEVWEPVIGFEGLYEVSNYGQIRSCERDVVCKDEKIKHFKTRILKPSIGKYGRNQYTLSKDGVKYPVREYQIVAQAFIPNSNNYLEINHIDGNNLNDNVDNLEWVSTEENIQHAQKYQLFNTYYKRFKK